MLSGATIGIIIFLVFIIIFVIIFVVLYSRDKISFDKNSTTGGGNDTTNILKYGDMIKINNINDRFGAGSLQVCGLQSVSMDTCTNNVSIVSEATTNNNQVWKITSIVSGKTGESVRYNESFNIISISNNANLGYCDSAGGCGTNVGILTNSSSNTSIWQFNKSITTTSDTVNFSDDVQIININDNNKLSACGNGGPGCGVNVTNINTGENVTNSRLVFSEWKLSAV